jgi:hypothetical protein
MLAVFRILNESDKYMPLSIFDLEARTVRVLRVPYGSFVTDAGNFNTVTGVTRIATSPPLNVG